MFYDERIKYSFDIANQSNVSHSDIHERNKCAIHKAMNQHIFSHIFALVVMKLSAEIILFCFKMILLRIEKNEINSQNNSNLNLFFSL